MSFKKEELEQFIKDIRFEELREVLDEIEKQNKPMSSKIAQLFDRIFDKIDPIDLMLHLGLGVHSYRTMKDVFNPLIAFLYGPLALKLATTQTYGGDLTFMFGAVEVPFNSQSVGITMLGALGLISIARPILEEQAEAYIRISEKLRQGESLTNDEYAFWVMQAGRFKSVSSIIGP